MCGAFDALLCVQMPGAAPHPAALPEADFAQWNRAVGHSLLLAQSCTSFVQVSAFPQQPHSLRPGTETL